MFPNSPAILLSVAIASAYGAVNSFLQIFKTFRRGPA